MLIFLVLGWVFVALALCGVGYALLAAQLAARFMQTRETTRPRPVPVTLLKPLHGAESGLAENLESFCRQNYAAPLQIVFGVHDQNDPALPIVEILKARFPAIEMQVVAD
ncbi:MAG TPA: hypothetical protein VIJ72_05140, partial [Rhizomicrobium sp.]